MSSHKPTKYATISIMILKDQRGVMDAWLMAFSLTLVLLFGSLGFGAWAFIGRQDYKNNVDIKIADAVASAQKETSDKKDKEFDEKEKEPYRDYVGPPAYGSIDIKYPKTWSAYVDESSRSNTPVDGYFNPATVPGLQSNASYAIRVKVTNTKYADDVRTFESVTKAGKVKVTPYSAPKVAGVVGIRLDGEVQTGKQGSMIILPLRDKTMRIWTESSKFVGDLDKIVLPNLVFIP